MMMKTIMVMALLIALAGCTEVQKESTTEQVAAMSDDAPSEMVQAGDTMEKVEPEKTEVATFAGGCFWCMEAGFEGQEGVVEAISGYTGGTVENPTYKEVGSGKTGHMEAVQVYYDPSRITYEQLLESFWIQIDPTDDGGQFADRGSEYRTAIFYKNETERMLAEKAIKDIAPLYDDPIVTQLLPVGSFYEAEEYHQDYYKKQQLKYKSYKIGSGREAFIKKNEERFAAASEDDLKEKLTPIQYKVTQEDGTEPPYNNEYWDNHEDGIYVDIVSGEPLFSSIDKYDSKTGWPSFTKPLEPDSIVEKTDYKLIAPRTEIRSRIADSHLGHVFEDGPEPLGLRYCMNSAALRFIPVDQLESEGYGDYEELFR